MKNQMYKKYENMINKHAWSFHRTTGLPFDELQAVCMKAYVEALDKYVPNQASFSTLLFTFCRNALIHFCKYEKQESREELGDWDTGLASTTENQLDLNRIIKKMSEEAQAVVDILFNCGEELTSIVHNSYNTSMKPRNVKLALKTFLRKLSWPESTITRTFKEIQGAVTEL